MSGNQTYLLEAVYQLVFLRITQTSRGALDAATCATFANAVVETREPRNLYLHEKQTA